MRRLILVAGVLAGLALGGLVVPLVIGGEAEKAPPAPAAPAAPAAPSASTPAPKAPASPSTATPPAKPGALEATAKDLDAGPVGEDIVITPPPPLPPVEIPPIPQASDKYPFGTPESKEKGSKGGKAGELTTGPDKPKTTIGGPRKIIEEGKRIFNREGRVGQDDHKQTVFAFGAGEGSILLLENSWRDFLETTTDFGKKDAHWRVSGLVTVYGHKNYLLITKCVRVMPEEENR
jgi:hypothetical protein